jgi:hypothetical protein
LEGKVGIPFENVSGSSIAAIAIFVKGPTATMVTVSSGSCFSTLKISKWASLGDGTKCLGGSSRILFQL